MSKQGSCAQHGMIASSPIADGETLFEIPRQSLLTHETCSISELLNRGSNILPKILFDLALASFNGTMHNCSATSIASNVFKSL